MHFRQTVKNRLSLLLVLLLLVSSLLSAFTPALAAGWQADTSTAQSASTKVEDYYAGLDTSLSGLAFREQLADLITKTHTKTTTYDGLKAVFSAADADPEKPGNIIWFYTGTSVPFSGFGSAGGTTNREHVWPKDAGKAFPEKTGPGSDGHHLRPTEANLNSTRGSKSFDEVPQTTANIVKQNGSASYENLCYTDGTFFYPGEGYRGATARILMYMQVRWGDQYGLTFVDGAGNCKTIGKISTLMKWHLEEPVTEEEIRRNEAVYAMQGNRNPFIDHPEYAEKIFCYDGRSYNAALQKVVAQYGSSQKVEAEQIALSAPEWLAAGQTIYLVPQVTPANATSTLVWESSDPTVAAVSGGRVTAGKAGTATITVRSADNSRVAASVTLSVKAAVAVQLSGTAANMTYTAGQTFDPTGLSVTVTYSDGSSDTVPTADCEWLDAATLTPALSAGTTAVVCRVGEVFCLLTGLVVKSSGTASITISRENFPNDSAAYGFREWTCGDIAGKAYVYCGNKEALQFNSSKPSQYLFNTVPLPSGILSVTLQMYSGEKDWELRVSDTPFGEVAGTPQTGTSMGTKTATEEGVTWTLDGTAKYFTLNYMSTQVAYVKSITVTYGAAEGCENGHDFGEWQTVMEPTETEEGLAVRVCDACGLTESKVLPVLSAIESFRRQVAAIASVSAIPCTEERHAALCRALATYQMLTDGEKAEVTEEMDTLTREIDAYNAAVNAANQSHTSFTEAVLSPASGSFPGIVAALRFLIQRVCCLK